MEVLDQLGKVFTLLDSGAQTNRELVEGGAAANQGAAANLRVTVRAVLDGIMPTGPSVALQSRRSIGGLLRDNPTLSDAAKARLEALRSALEQISNNETAVRAEEADIEAAATTLEKKAADLAGVYVYTLPTFFRTTQKVDPDRYWFKVGKTDRVAGIRIGEQGRATGLPEDPWLLRVSQRNQDPGPTRAGVPPAPRRRRPREVVGTQHRSRVVRHQSRVSRHHRPHARLRGSRSGAAKRVVHWSPPAHPLAGYGLANVGR